MQFVVSGVFLVGVHYECLLFVVVCVFLWTFVVCCVVRCWMRVVRCRRSWSFVVLVLFLIDMFDCSLFDVFSFWFACCVLSVFVYVCVLLFIVRCL